jgi:serine phosphatase RsbU (regulator of sigma subunit)
VLQFAVAGHNPPRLVRRGEVLSVEGQGGLPLGIMPEVVYHESTGVLEEDDLVVLYTDGITEAAARGPLSGQRPMFGTSRLDSALRQTQGMSAEQCLQLICDEVESFSGAGAPVDDQTLIAVRCLS